MLAIVSLHEISSEDLAMKFYESFSAGDRVEVASDEGFTSLGLGASDGDRGTVVEKYPGNFLDRISCYQVEMDYPVSPPFRTISGRYLRRLSPEEDPEPNHRNLKTGDHVFARIPEHGALPKEGSASSILLPELHGESKREGKKAVVVECRPGKRRHEPDQYRLKWETGESDWISEIEIWGSSGPGSCMEQAY